MKLDTIYLDPAKIVCFDTETTGLDSDAEIVQIAIVNVDEEPIFDRLIKPVRPIPAEATKIHGITNEMVAGSLGFDYWGNHILGGKLGEKIVLGFNVQYDIRMLSQSLAAVGQSNVRFSPIMVIDVMQIAKLVLGLQQWPHLYDACERAEVEPVEGAFHDALFDATMTMRLWKKLLRLQDGLKVLL